MDATISLIMPVFNGARYLRESLASLLSQTLPATEIIVIDDGSTDHSAEIAGDYPVTLLRQQNAGAAAARNRGIEASTGALIACLDSDDVATPDRLQQQVAAFESTP